MATVNGRTLSSFVSSLLTSTIDAALSLADDIIDLDQLSVVTDDAVAQTTPALSGPGVGSTVPSLPRGSIADDDLEDEAITTLRLQEERISYAREHRKGTDKRVYGYYISQIGLVQFLLFLACCIGQVLGFYMPRTSYLWLLLLQNGG
jgi:hypothetical protein